MAPGGGRAVHVGDTARRVDAPLPGSLTELIGRAEVNFGHTGNLKLYHNGRVPITKESQLQQLRDDDVVVVTWDDRRALTTAAELVSTHQHDFVAHRPLGQSRCFKPRPSPPLPLPFRGDTDYRINYIGFKVSQPEVPNRQRPRSEASLRRPPDRLESTYRATYHPPPHQPRRKDPPYRVGQPPLHLAQPFTGESVYARDFRTHDRARSLTPSSGPHRRPRTEAPFNGASTYKVDYIEWPLEKKRPPAQRPPMPRLSRMAPAPAPLPAPAPKKPLRIHLEPEVGKIK